MKAVFWALVNWLQAVFSVLWSLLWIPAALAVRLVCRDPGPSLAMARRIWAPGILWVCGAQLEVRGLEHLEAGRPYLFAVNHQSQMDIPAVFRALPMNILFLVKDELRRVPVLGHYISAMGMVFIDRRDRGRALKRMRRMTEQLAAGACFVTFPEGSRSRDGEIRSFKSGALLPALDAGVAVVPMALEGGDRVLPPGRLTCRPGLIRVALGEPIAVEGLSASDRRAFAGRVERRVRELYDGLRRESGVLQS